MLWLIDWGPVVEIKGKNASVSIKVLLVSNEWWLPRMDFSNSDENENPKNQFEYLLQPLITSLLFILSFFLLVLDFDMKILSEKLKEVKRSVIWTYLSVEAIDFNILLARMVGIHVVHHGHVDRVLVAASRTWIALCPAVDPHSVSQHHLFLLGTYIAQRALEPNLP